MSLDPSTGLAWLARSLERSGEVAATLSELGELLSDGGALGAAPGLAGRLEVVVPLGKGWVLPPPEPLGGGGAGPTGVRGEHSRSRSRGAAGSFAGVGVRIALVSVEGVQSAAVGGLAGREQVGARRERGRGRALP